MKRAIKIDLSNGLVTLHDGSQKTLDNYVFELEDRLIKIQELLQDYGDVDPNCEYLLDGELLFKVMDYIEGKEIGG